jgi:anthranilate 1,2-dioxygenase small subunit
MIDAALLIRLEMQALLDAYVATIDEDRLEQWPAFFTEDCLYEIIPKENEDAGLPIGIMRCDNQRMIRDRVISLRNANIYAPATYRHFLSGLVIESASEDEVVFSCNYLVINSNQLGQSLVYQTGRYHDRVVRGPHGWLFASKRCVFDTSRVQTLLAIPV